MSEEKLRYYLYLEIYSSWNERISFVFVREIVKYIRDDVVFRTLF